MPRPSRRTLVLLLAAAALVVSGCGEVESSTTTGTAPAKIEPVDGTTLKRVVLVPRAVERLDIKTAAVRPATPQEMEGVTPAGQSGRSVVPFDAVLYDKAGAPFTYTNAKQYEYVHQPITLDGIKNKLAIVSAGLSVGTEVVTVGGIELYGVETGVGK